MTAPGPTLPVELRLGSALAAAVGPGRSQVADALEARVAGVAETLGVPVRPVVRVRVTDGAPTAELVVGSRRLPLPGAAVRNARLFVSPGLALPPRSGWADWLDPLGGPGSQGGARGAGQDADQDADRGADQDLAARILGLVLDDAVARTPAAVLTPAAAVQWLDRVAAELPEPAARGARGIGEASLLDILERVLSLGISVADVARAGHVLGRTMALDAGVDAVAEALIAELRPGTLAVHCDPATAERFRPTERGDDPLQELQAMMRDGLFYELGIRVPPMEIVADASLDPGALAVRINHVRGPVYRGLRTGEQLVNVDPAELEGHDPRPGVNPVNGAVLSVVSDALAAELEAQGHATWDPRGYLILIASTEIRRQADRFVDQAGTEFALAQLSQAFPSTVRAALDELPAPALTGMLRALVAEEISIRDLRTILCAVLDYDAVVTDPSRLIILDDRLAVDERLAPAAAAAAPALRLEYVRSRLKSYISHRFTRGRNVLSVYLLDQERIEDRIMEHVSPDGGGHGPLDDAEIASIIRAIEAEVTVHPELRPVILTTSDVRAPLARFLRPALPEAAVLSYSELSPDMNIQPLSRITAAPHDP